MLLERNKKNAEKLLDCPSAVRIFQLFQKHPFRRFSNAEIAAGTSSTPGESTEAADKMASLGILKRLKVQDDVCFKADYHGRPWQWFSALVNDRQYIYRPPTHRSSRAVFLDRDGVINSVIFRDGRPASPRRLEEFTWEKGVRAALTTLKSYGYVLLVTTNQPDVARGYLSEDMLDAMTEQLYSDIPIDAIWICPHDKGDGCECRKPKPGMLLDAAKTWGIDCNRSYMVGDTWKDMDAGRAAGCTTILLDRPYNTATVSDYRASDLQAAVKVMTGSPNPCPIYDIVEANGGETKCFGSTNT